jgi:hypothetical protein
VWCRCPVLCAFVVVLVHMLGLPGGCVSVLQGLSCVLLWCWCMCWAFLGQVQECHLVTAVLLDLGMSVTWELLATPVQS